MSGDVDNKDSDHTKQENVDLESEGKEVLKEQALSNNTKNFQEDDEIFPYRVSPSVKTDNVTSDNICLLQEMFGRVVTEQDQENMACRLLHREIVVKTFRNFGEGKNKDKSVAASLEKVYGVKGIQASSTVHEGNDKTEADFSDNVDDMKSMQSTYVEYKIRNKNKAIQFENVDDMKSKQSSSRMNSLGYKIASKIFKFFV